MIFTLRQWVVIAVVALIAALALWFSLNPTSSMPGGALKPPPTPSPATSTLPQPMAAPKTPNDVSAEQTGSASAQVPVNAQGVPAPIAPPPTPSH